MSKEEWQIRWLKEAEEVFVGKQIVSVRMMSDQEKEDHDWYEDTIIYTLDDGTMFYASKDPEGNGAGSIFTTHPQYDTF